MKPCAFTVWWPHGCLVTPIGGDKREEVRGNLAWGLWPSPSTYCVRVCTCLSKYPLPSGSAKSHICGNTKVLVSVTADHFLTKQEPPSPLTYTCEPYIQVPAGRPRQGERPGPRPLPSEAHSRQPHSPENSQVY